MALPTSALKLLTTTEAGIPLSELGSKLEEVQKVLAEIGVFIGDPSSSKNNFPNFDVHTEEGLKWGSSTEFEQKALTAKCTLYFMKHHDEDEKVD